MRKSLVGITGIGVVCVVAYWIYVSLVSDSTRIRWLLDEMEDGFNASSARAVVSGLSKDFQEETSRVSSQDIRSFLVYTFLKERDSKTKEFRFRVELGEPQIEVQEPEKKEATVKVRAGFFERRGDRWRVVWEVDIEGDLEKREEGWKIVRSRHATAEGKRPF